MKVSCNDLMENQVSLGSFILQDCYEIVKNQEQTICEYAFHQHVLSN